MNPINLIEKPVNSTEVLNKRTLNSKTFNKGGGKFKLFKFFGAIHYKNNFDDTTEEWKEIDLTPQEQVNKFVISEAPYNLEVAKNQVGFAYTSKRGGSVTARLKAIDDNLLKDLNLNLNARLENNKIYWDDVRPGLDIYIELRSSGVEFFKVLKNDQAPTKLEWEIEEDENSRFISKMVSSGIDNQKRQVKIINTIVDGGVVEGKKSYNLIEQFEPKTAVIEDKRKRIKSWVDEIEYPLLIDVPDITEDITDSIDDGHHGTDPGGWDTDGIGNRWVVGDSGVAYKYYGGLRFQTLAIPQAATIDLANLKVKIANLAGSAPANKFYADDVDDAPAFSNANLPNGITKTSASADFNPAGTGAFTVAVTSIVQEIIDRGGWSSNNDIRFGFFGDQGGGLKNVYVSDYAGGQADAAHLEIDFTVSAAAPSIVGWKTLLGVGQG